MEDKVLRALKASIRKWRRNSKARSSKTATTGPEDCALCSLFYWEKDCKGCPVSQRVKDTHCRGTPYTQEAITELFYSWGITEEAALSGVDKKENNKTRLELKKMFHKASTKEVAFLESLLPEGETL